MKPFTKLFSSILSSSIWAEDNETRIVWITMLAMADREGIVFASIGGLAHQARVDIDACMRSLTILSNEDPDSRTEAHEGRRIEFVEGGWRILNYMKYRELGRAEDRREYFAARKRIQRARKKGGTGVHNVQDKSTVSTKSPQKSPIAEAEAEAEAEARSSVPCTPITSLSDKAYKGESRKLDKVDKEKRTTIQWFEALLGEQWENDAGKWVNRVKSSHGKAERVAAELRDAIKEGRVIESPAQYAEYLWGEFS